jgi:hypothetical protein
VIDRYINDPCSTVCLFLETDAWGCRKSKFHCHTYNKADSMRADRDVERGMVRSEHGAEAKGRP